MENIRQQHLKVRRSQVRGHPGCVVVEEEQWSDCGVPAASPSGGFYSDEQQLVILQLLVTVRRSPWFWLLFLSLLRLNELFCLCSPVEMLLMVSL